MKGIKRLIFALMVLCLPISVFAAGVTVDKTSVSLKPGGSAKITITLDDAAGTVNISSNNTAIATVDKSGDFLDSNPGSKMTYTFNIKGIKTGDAIVSVAVDAGIYTGEVPVKKTYKINVRVQSNIATLSSIKVDGKSYTVSDTINIGDVSNGSIKIEAVATDSKAKVAGVGTKTLKWGANTFPITVTAEDGSKKTYNVKVNKPDTRDGVNTLSSLSVDGYTISPSFKSDVTSYTLNVDNDVSKVTIKATKTGDKSSFVKGYGARDVTLKYGNNAVQVKVMAENEKVRIYTITINRKDNRDAVNTLKSLSVDVGNIKFNKNTTTYNLYVANNIKEATIKAETDSDKASLTGAGKVTLKEGDNSFNIVVTAENETKKTYTVNIKRLKEGEEAPEDIEFIKTLKVNGKDIGFNKDTKMYKVLLNEGETLDLKYELGDGVTAKIEGNENLKDDSEVKLILESNSGAKDEYTFLIRIPVVCEEPKKDNTLAIILGIIAGLELLAIIFLLIKKTNKKDSNDKKIETTEYTQTVSSTPTYTSSTIKSNNDNNKVDFSGTYTTSSATQAAYSSYDVPDRDLPVASVIEINDKK